MTAEAPNKRPPTPDETTGGENDLRHYTPDEVVDPAGDFRLPTTALMLRKWAYRREIPHSKLGGRITFTRSDIRGISERFAVSPENHGRGRRRKTSAA